MHQDVKISIKRSKIGALANKYCDYVILTEQDERDDDIEGICSQIQEQIVNPISVIITDRRYAIQQAIDAACPGDVILILGKGHEQFMTSLVGNTPYPEINSLLRNMRKNSIMNN